MIVTLGVSLGALIALVAYSSWNNARELAARPACPSVRVIDGDTFDCGNERIRMDGIDAPEMPGHCRLGRRCTPGDPFASTENLRRLVGGNDPVRCRAVSEDIYGRTVARCYAGNLDLSCAQLADGFAVRRYSLILCWPGN